MTTAILENIVSDYLTFICLKCLALCSVRFIWKAAWLADTSLLNPVLRPVFGVYQYIEATYIQTLAYKLIFKLIYKLIIMQ